MLRAIVGCAFVALLMLNFTQHASGQESEKTDLYTLVLVESDLADATRVMTVYDPNEDGVIDKQEQQRLSWNEEVKDYDMNRDGKLTHLEVAVRLAKLRGDNDVTQFDIKNVNIFLRRYDSNRNGQLEPDEIAAGNWPPAPEDYDKNGDGILTVREMAIQFAFNRGLRREMGIEAIDQTGAGALVRFFDQDNDKKLSAEEYANAPLPKPGKSFDEDDDGKLSSVELATMLSKHRRENGLSKPDVTKIRRLFQQFDPQYSGQIDLKMFAEGPFGENYLAQLETYDADKNKVVTIAEVEKIVAEVRKQRGYAEEEFQKAKTMITRHDRNRSKHIEESELHDKPGPGQLPKSMMKEADLNEDGKVGLDELSRYFAKQKK